MWACAWASKRRVSGSVAEWGETVGVDVLTGSVIVVGVLGVAGTVLDVWALARKRGQRLAWSGIVLRVLGVAALFGLVLAGRGRPDFEDLIFALYGMFAGIALWFSAAVTDTVLLVRHFARRRGDDPGPVA